jgi:mono/diheme cytochrome c family protein
VPGEARLTDIRIEGDVPVRRATACLLLLILALAAGCGSDDGSKEDAAAAARARAREALHARRMAVGRRVFEEHCHSCHTLGGVKYTGPIIEFEAPNLDEVRLKREYVRERVEFGGPAMASFTGEMSRAEFASVVEYVTEASGGDVVDDGDQPADVLAAGREVFGQHCAVCHAIEGRAPTGRPAYPATDFTIVKPGERFILKRLHTGVLPEPGGMMPSFRGNLSDEQMRAVATYVTAVAKEGPEAPKPEEAEAELE